MEAANSQRSRGNCRGVPAGAPQLRIAGYKDPLILELLDLLHLTPSELSPSTFSVRERSRWWEEVERRWVVGSKDFWVESCQRLWCRPHPHGGGEGVLLLPLPNKGRPPASRPEQEAGPRVGSNPEKWEKHLSRWGGIVPSVAPHSPTAEAWSEPCENWETLLGGTPSPLLQSASSGTNPGGRSGHQDSTITTTPISLSVLPASRDSIWILKLGP